MKSFVPTITQDEQPEDPIGASTAADDQLELTAEALQEQATQAEDQQS